MHGGSAEFRRGCYIRIIYVIEICIHVDRWIHK